MATIDNLDISVYRLYAQRTKAIEETNNQFRLQEAASIPPQTLIVDAIPKLTELDILLGVVPYHTPWAFFFPPKTFDRTRRSSFSFSRVVPSLGTPEEQAEDERIVASTKCKTNEELEEQQMLARCFKQINKLNDMLGHIIGRIGQFLQG
jgi:hypothetical protein